MRSAKTTSFEGVGLRALELELSSTASNFSAISRVCVCVRFGIPDFLYVVSYAPYPRCYFLGFLSFIFRINPSMTV